MSGQRDIRLLLADVDGTLVTQDKVLTDQTVAVAQELREAGITLAITSGRPPRGMSMLIAPLKLEGAIAGFNGGVFVHPDLSVIESHILDFAAAKETLQLILDQGLDAWVYTEKEWLIRDSNAPHVARETWTVKFDAKVVASFTDAHLADAVKIVGVSDDLDRVAACEKLAQKKLGRNASAARSQPYYLDVTHPQANKGAVVLTLSKLLGIAPEQMATIGDMPNDVLMFRNSGLSIAMGNSSDEVKSQATAVTDSNQNEGFANAVRKFILRTSRVMRSRSAIMRGTQQREPVSSLSVDERGTNRRIGKRQLPAAAERLEQLHEIERDVGRAGGILLFGLQQRPLGIKHGEKVGDAVIVPGAGQRRAPGANGRPALSSGPGGSVRDDGQPAR